MLIQRAGIYCISGGQSFSFDMGTNNLAKKLFQIVSLLPLKTISFHFFG